MAWSKASFNGLEVYKDTSQVKLIRGGVARNVAECMSKLGSKPFIVSIVGIDAAGGYLVFSCMFNLLPLGFWINQYVYLNYCRSNIVGVLEIS